MAWPGTPGGAGSPHWGDNVRLYIWAAIQAGTTMHWGTHAADRLNAGNVWSTGGPGPGPTPPSGTLWVDVSCDVLELEVHLGADQTNPPANTADAGTCSFVLADPHRRYDPLNPDSPYMYGGRSRLGAGTHIYVFAETLTGSTVDRWPLFTGTVDTWREDWTPHPARRRAEVVASDAVKTLAYLDWGEQPAVGGGETQAARIGRILDYYGFTGPRAIDTTSTIRYAATTLAQSAWELLGRTMTDANGYLFIAADGSVTTTAETAWANPNPPLILQVGCAGAEAGVYEIARSVEVDTSTITNSVSASRPGGTMTRYLNATSVGLYGEHGTKRTDLGLNTDADVARYATSVLQTQAFPRGQLTGVGLRPQIDPASWPTVFRNQANLSKENMRVLWAPPHGGATYDVTGRPFGVTHHVTQQAWDVDYALAYADVYSRIMHWGPHAYDRLTAANVYT